MKAAEVRAIARRLVDALAGDPRVRLVYLFGSAADPEAAGVRDLDLALAGAPPFSREELLEMAVRLGTQAGLPLDLVPLERAPVVLAHEIADNGLCLLARPPEAETSFVLRARDAYWDFKPLLEQQWRLAGERQEARLRGPQA
ncbi:MAG TPA: nucleotidyltransferase domain-containing protein [Candidatus Polarisedimenticolaceae bacterium]|nr:nucleotidyltransferase domain-containing protein [Candidatus Polarisedimenticolaceae bacterium]